MPRSPAGLRPGQRGRTGRRQGGKAGSWESLRSLETAGNRHFIDLAITRDGSGQELDGTGADAGKILQFELEEEGGVGGAAQGLQALGDEAGRPAAGVVFDPGKAFQQALVPDRVIVASDRIP